MDNALLIKEINNIESESTKNALKQLLMKIGDIAKAVDKINDIVDNNTSNISKSDMRDIYYKINKIQQNYERDYEILRDDIYKELNDIKSSIKKTNENVNYKISNTSRDLAHNLSLLRENYTSPHSRSKSNIKKI